MRRRHQFIVAAMIGILSVGQASGRSQGLTQTVTQKMVEQTVADVRFSTQAGFALERVNPADKRDSYVVVTFDHQGRLVVSKENDNPRWLIDENRDGVYEGEKVISDKVRNCQGLWFDGPVMYGACMPPAPPAPPPAPGAPAAAPGGGGGRGNQGPQQVASIFKLTDADGDGTYETSEIFGRVQGRIEEHGPHAVRRGPDGQMTFMAGNFAVVAPEDIDQKSSVLVDKDVQFLPRINNWQESAREGVHSGVYRYDPATKKFVVLFGGNRNSYDVAYNLSGEAFLFDSDMEWDIGMPWYRDVRTIHGIPNGNYGYRNHSGKYTELYLDSLPAVRDLGRGSPVGVEFYQSYAYPREFYDNFLEADWSRGRLLYTALTPKGATYTGRTDRAEFVHGEPLNITDVEVGPDGNVYFTTGGRNTQGGVWRVKYTGTRPAQPDMAGILAVVRQPQPLSSFGWAAIEGVKAKMGAGFATELEKLARSAGANAEDRARAIYEMQRHGAPPNAALLTALMTDKVPAVRAAAVYVAGVQGEAQKAAIAAGLKDTDPVVQRRAAEALVRIGQSADKPSLVPVADIYALLNSPDRFVRWAGRIAIEHTPRADWKDRAMTETNPLGAIEGMLAIVRTAPAGESFQPILTKQFALMKQTNLSVENKLRLFRAFEYTAAETPGGLTAAQREQLHGLVVNQFPATDERMNRELAFILAYAGQPQGISEILAAMPKGNDNTALQLHYLYALRTIKTGWTLEQKTALAEVLGRAAKWRGGAQFANFLAALYDQSSEVYTTDAEKKILYEKAPDFAPLTPEELAQMQAARGGGAGRQGGGGGGQGGGQGAAPAAGQPAGAGAVVPPPAGVGQSGAAAPPAGATPPAGAAAAGQQAGARQGGPGGGRGGGNQAGITARTQGRVLSKEELFDEFIFTPQANQPNREAGRTAFETQCASCHKFGAIGNDHGIAALNLTAMGASPTGKRDILEAVLWPSRKVAAAHQTTVVDTTDGKTINALVLRETPQALTLLGADGKTSDLPKSQVKASRKVTTSLMPEMLVDTVGRGPLGSILAFLTAPPPSSPASLAPVSSRQK